MSLGYTNPNMQSYFTQKHVVVTGAAGFIGSHLCDQLVASGAQVTGIDNFLTGRRENIAHLLSQPKTFRFIEADVTTAPESYLPSEKIDLILHFASPASPPRYQAHPVETYLVNSHATHLLLTHLQKTNPHARFLFASTSEIYGNPAQHPQSESYWGNVNPNGIRSCYDEAKRMGETICGVFYRDFGMDTRLVRIFNTYGPRMDPSDGRVIPDFIMKALADRPLLIHGDGSQTRSYCYYQDLVAGILRFASLPDLSGETINLGNDAELTVKETAEIIYKTIHPETTIAPLTFKPLPQDDPLRRKPDLSKARRLLEWQPQVSFADGLQSTIEYFRTQPQR